MESINKINITYLLNEYPLFNDIMTLKEIFWTNPLYDNTKLNSLPINKDDVKDAEDRLLRFSKYIMKVFPETKKSHGIIESKLMQTKNIKTYLENEFKIQMPGSLFLKCDNELPISGSIKARGGIYEVLKHAEDLAISNNLLSLEDDYSKLDDDKFREFFSNFSIAVGSTGNLGLSIGIISSKLGFKVTVHMSKDAKKWKKDLLRSKGVNVIEYEDDYSMAVKQGRNECINDPNCYFIDDENSKDLFLGYAVAALRLKTQLENLNIHVSNDTPLFLYLPCGVGGGPGGVAFGLKLLFGENVHCFFVEPTHSPCMLIGSMTKLHNNISVTDIGLDNKTCADGLAVGRASGFVGKTMENLLSGVYTIEDNKLLLMVKKMYEMENVFLEPSACAGIYGIYNLYNSENGIKYISENKLIDKMNNSIHIAWGTGGSMVPEDERELILLGGN